MAKNLFQKVWDAHAVRVLANGQTQLLIGTHLIHEVTSPQAFGMLRDLGIKVKYPERTFATVDHIVPTDQREQPFKVLLLIRPVVHSGALTDLLGDEGGMRFLNIIDENGEPMPLTLPI